MILMVSIWYLIFTKGTEFLNYKIEKQVSFERVEVVDENFPLTTAKEWRFEPYLAINTKLPIEYATLAIAEATIRPGSWNPVETLDLTPCEEIEELDPPLDKKFQNKPNNNFCVDPSLLKLGFQKNFRIITILCKNYHKHKQT